ncbi:HD domain-containing protein [Oceanobacillus piezotolerans]|uniref:HD domain-containing protein n=1 Tax=Oceanobacillus piezotolerans TaxID=2448030 RepID=A0A498DNZ1_9BACI|nr:HD domain-containing protein [Oceanobacillus piezotolerans]RLL45442.1 HD domain-containing protein [Oceanobacillus piezotolerans]
MKRNVTLEKLFIHPIVQKYVGRSGMAHAISVAEMAYDIALKTNVNPDLAAKAGFLHDIGHYEWYSKDGEWNYEMYKENDIHAIKGAARAHKLLVRCGENLHDAKEIALAVLLHTDSYLPEGKLHLNSLQTVVAEADEKDEEPGGGHHYREIDYFSALERIQVLDERIQQTLQSNSLEQTS